MSILLKDICDLTSTRAIYAATSGDNCACSLCRNMRGQMDRIPEVIREAIGAMGIDLTKPGEIVEFGRSASGWIYEIEWPFVAGEAASIADAGRTVVEHCEVRWSPGGIPAREFDETGRRWSVCVLLRDVPWVLEGATSSL